MQIAAVFFSEATLFNRQCHLEEMKQPVLKMPPSLPLKEAVGPIVSAGNPSRKKLLRSKNPEQFFFYIMQVLYLPEDAKLILKNMRGEFQDFSYRKFKLKRNMMFCHKPAKKQILMYAVHRLYCVSQGGILSLRYSRYRNEFR